jgi:predicted amidohydrolase YtcJ
MSQRLRFLPFFVVAFLWFIYFINSTTREASLLLVNGIVHTLNPEQPIAQAVAIQRGRIVGTGMSDDLIRTFKAENIIDLEGKTVVPGFIDGHAHMNGLGKLMKSMILVGIDSPQRIADLVKERASRAGRGEWLYGRGWDQNLWPDKRFPTKEILDAVTPHNPVILGRIDGHAIWTNSFAMEIAGVTKETKDPQGGRIVRDANGNPTGVFIDQAKQLIEEAFPPQTQSEIEQSLLRAAEACIGLGLTQVHDMEISTEMDAYRRLAEQGKLPLRIYAALDATSTVWQSAQLSTPLVGLNNDMLTIRAFKFYIDGALGSRGAALFQEYADDPGNRGITYLSEDELETSLLEGIKRGFQPCVHAIGDRGNHIVLNVYERLLRSIPAGDYRMRIEHAQVVDHEDISRFKALGVLPSMQPVHCTSDMYWAEARLGNERVRNAYPWRSLLETGTLIIGGTDFPNDDMAPLHNFYAAVTRSDRNGYPANGWYGKQKMTRDEALRALTLWPAYGAFHERIKGSIEYGKYADFTILSKDIMTIPSHEILETEVEMTIVGGRIVYAKPKEPLP